MLNHSKLARKPRQFQSITGITPQQFDFLYDTIKKRYRTTEEKRLSSKTRKRSVGAGHPFSLALKDRILMLLMYYRMYTSYGLLEVIFDLDKSNVCRDIRYMEPAVKSCILVPAKKYASAKKVTTLEELERQFPEFQIIIDATEQPIPKPKDKKKRRKYYSGKKKRHTIKNQYTINMRGEIIHKPPHSTGRHHDYHIFKAKHPILPEGLQTFVDLGHMGMQKDYPQYNAILPHKKRKGEKLTVLQKQFNKVQSKTRIRIEHVISRVKKFRICSDVFRNKLCRYDTISEIVCGLINFKIRWKEKFVVAIS